jgi:SAM-dependent methyltransferase
MRQVARALRRRLRRFVRPAPVARLRSIVPVSDDFGFDRGTPVDRHYIERFLAKHTADISGRVLEVKDAAYTHRFGRGIDRSDVLDIDAGNTNATFVADLTRADAVPSDTFDCFILTQTLQYIPDTKAALLHAHRVLRRNGVILATLPVVSRFGSLSEVAPDCWRFTPSVCSVLFGAAFGTEHVAVHAHGNLLTCVAFLAGIACEELDPRDLENDDPAFPLIVTVRAVKS